MMIESKNFAKYITEIFNAEYGLRLKYDQTARLVCDVLNAGTVSLLLYDSNQDVLVCKGCYINPKNSKLKTEDKILKSILDEVGVYEYMKYKKQPKGSFDCSKLFREYSQSLSFFKKVEEDKFLSICNDNKDNFQKYDHYKSLFSKEKYAIDSKTITGEYFSNLLDLDTTYTVKTKICDLSKYTPEQKQCFSLLKDELGIQIAENGFYIGLPLYATERYFGILRILYPKKTGFIVKDSTTGFKLNDEFQERLGYFSQLISLHLETNYYLEGYKKLSLINETITPDTISNLKSTCEILSGVVNCNGAIIRIFNEKTEKPEIIGFTKTMEEYVEFIKTYKDEEYPEANQFSVSLVSLFKDDISIVAVNFDTETIKAKSVHIFSIDEDNNIKESEKELEILDLKSKPYREKLHELNIKQITVVPIPNVKDSYMTFSNTQNRKFIKADVEMLILAVRGIGLEIKHITDSEKIVDQKQVIAQTESIRNVIHQVGAPLHGILIHTSNVVNRKVPDYLIKDRMFYIFQMIKNSIRQLSRFQRILELDTRPIVANKKRIINLPKYLIGKSIEFQAITSAKKITIHVYANNSFSPYENIEIDDELFDEVITNLIDNAVKYSFHSSELKLRGIKYDETDRKSEGNILIYYSVTVDKILVRITNWGATILPEETAKIFERHFRGKNANNFSPIGSGIGLFLVKRIVDAMNATISVHSEKFKTVFTLTFKR